VIGGLLGVGNVPYTKEEIMKVNERDEVTATVGDSVAAVLESYRVFLVDERGLAAESVRCYLLDARVFLTQLPDPLAVSLAGLSAGQVTGFVLGYCRSQHLVGQGDGHRAAVAAAVPACVRVGTGAAGRGCALGRELAGSVATPRPGRRPGDCDVGQL
jgi:hypothetical protein